MRTRRVRLEFARKVVKKRPELPFELSAVERVGNDLWVASDESASLDRLSRIAERRFGDHASFALERYLQLPAGPGYEIDIEGLAFEPPYLWLAGSHSLTRSKPKGKNLQKDLRRLATMDRDTNRYLLARIPVHVDPATGRSELRRSLPDPAKPARELTAAQVFGTAHTNLLTDAVGRDEHLGRFLSIPAKENGFDIEGLAVLGDSVFVGLRGPVLQGWAVILEVRPAALSREYLTLEPFKRGALYRKHFVDLHGLGVRELCRDGDDLLIMAGPTLDVAGPQQVYRWRKVTRLKRDAIVERDDLELVLDLTPRSPGPQGEDHAEGLCLYRKGELLVVYDSPSDERVASKRRVEADVLPI